MKEIMSVLDVKAWIIGKKKVKKIEFIREHAKGKLFAVELENGDFYRALWIDADPPELVMDEAGPKTQYPTIPDFLADSKPVAKAKKK